MAGYLLDTNHAAALVTLGHVVPRRVMLRLASGDTFAICVPVVAETLFGIGLLPRAKQNLAEWARLRSNFTCLIPDESDAEKSAALRCDLRRRGHQLDTIDALIAILALRNNLVLLTTDRDFSAVPGLRVENWFAP